MEKHFLQIKNVHKYFCIGKGQTIKALDGVSLDICEGEIFGLLGVNGAGKTTLSSILATLHPPTSGDIAFGGSSIYRDINSFRRTIGFCPQKPNLINELTVRQNLFFAGLYFGLPKNVVAQHLEKLSDQFELTKYLDAKPETLSGGYKQRVSIARALMHSPKIVILDEPTVGLDPHIRHKLWEVIRNLKETNVTVILTTHYLDEAEILSDRICILDSGKVRIIDTPENLMTSFQKSRLEEVFLQLMKEEPEQ